MKKTECPPFVPETPWVYKFLSKGKKILYIGKAKNLSKRISQYFSPGSVWKLDMVASAATIEYVQTGSEKEALLLEEELIKQYMPPYNRLLKHNSNYVYVRISKEEFPKVSIVRKRRDDKAIYIGPKQRNRMLYKMLKYLRRIYKRRTLSDSQFKQRIIDMDFHLKLDEGWSLIQDIDTDEGKEKAKKMGIDTTLSKKERIELYQSRMKLLKKLLEGNTRAVLKKLEEDITYHVSKENYERCAQLKDIYEYILSREEKSQTIVMNRSRNGRYTTVTHLEQYHIIVSLKVFEWRIVDVITEQYSDEEKTWESIVINLKIEFGVEVIEENKESSILVSHSGGKVMKAEWEWLKTFSDSVLQSYLLSHAFQKESAMGDLLKQLQRRYQLKHLPYHIECLDISHFSWDDASGWLSSFINWAPMKKWYRQYKLDKNNAGDDFASLKEVLIRRFRLKETSVVIPSSELPNLFIIDWGKGQIWIIQDLVDQYPRAKEYFFKHMDLVSLGKGKARSRKGKGEGFTEVLLWPLLWESFDTTALVYDQVDRLLIQARDEAHRFSNRYRKKQMSKKRKPKSI